MGNSVLLLLLLTQVEIEDAARPCSPLLLGHQSRVKGLWAGSHTACRTHLPRYRRGYNYSKKYSYFFFRLT